jgi:hypothetical protein
MLIVVIWMRIVKVARLKVGGKGGNVHKQAIKDAHKKPVEVVECGEDGLPLLYNGCRRCSVCGLTTGPYFEMLVRSGVKVDVGWTKVGGQDVCYKHGDRSSEDRAPTAMVTL